MYEAWPDGVEQETTVKMTLAGERGHSLTQAVNGWCFPLLVLLWPTTFNCGTLRETLGGFSAYKSYLQISLSNSPLHHLETSCAYWRVPGLYSSRNLDSGSFKFPTHKQCKMVSFLIYRQCGLMDALLQDSSLLCSLPGSSFLYSQWKGLHGKKASDT